MALRPAGPSRCCRGPVVAGTWRLTAYGLALEPAPPPLTRRGAPGRSLEAVFSLRTAPSVRSSSEAIVGASST